MIKPEEKRMFRLNPDCWGSCIAIPNSILNEHLKLASGASLKVLLLILSDNSNQCTKAIAKATGLTTAVVEDSLLYWQKENVLILEKTEQPEKEEVQKKEETPKKSVKEKKIERPVPQIPIKPPTHREVAKRLSESEELSFIFSEAQNVLSKTFGYNTQAILLMIYDYYGFSADIILMLVQHAKLLGNTSAAGLKKLAEEWGKNGVKTLSDAEKEIGLHNEVVSIFSLLSNKFDFGRKEPNGTQVRYLRGWIETLSFDTDIILLAFEKAESDGANNSFSYANKTLRQWHSKGYRDKKTIAAKICPAGKFNKGKKERSYDKVKMGRSVIYDWIEKTEGGL